jgi:caffeoyl-CoA O-methyltransferase
VRHLVIATAAALTLIATAAAAAQERGGSPQGQGGPRVNPLLAVFDANGDGTLSKEEIDNASAKLKALDKNGDGALGADELRVQGQGRGGQPESGRGGPAASEAASSDIQKPVVPKNDFEKNLLAAYDEMRKGQRYLNVAADHGRLLRLLTESIGAKCAVEIGTSTGESAVWLALGLKATGGKLLTHEIDKGRAAIARENFKKAGVADFVTVIEGDAHETVKQHKDPIDILFLDADKEGYVDYLEKLLPLVRPGGLIVGHNMNTRQADPRYVKAITTNPDLETIILYADQGGVSVTLKKR